MRIDKFLKNSRLIKRRTVAQQACQSGRISINGKVVKPSSAVSAGDVIEVAFATGTRRFQVLDLPLKASKDGGPWVKEL